MSEFWKKRFVRLFPAMLVCSLITLIAFRLFDSTNLFPRSHKAVNFFYSLAFVNPAFLDNLLKPWDIKGTMLSGSYWSLWPEIQFYLAASLVYFISPRNFFRNFILVSVTLFVFTKLVHYLVLGGMSPDNPLNGTWQNIFKLVQIFSYSILSVWFITGVVFYRLYSGYRDRFTLSSFVLILFLQWWECDDYKILSVVLLMDILFLLFIFYPRYLNFLNFRFITAAGISSYSLYLIHESLGILMINRIGPYFGNFSFLVPILVLTLFVGFSLALYKYVERPLGGRLKNSLRKTEVSEVKVD